jgi:subtilisin family serine protease
MERSSGRPDVSIALIDGPVAISHPELNGEHIRELPGTAPVSCRSSSPSCRHGTLVAGVLCGKRGGAAPAIAPDCTLLVRPIFGDFESTSRDLTSATPEELSRAIVDAVDGGARLLNVSASLSQPSPTGERTLDEALNHAASRGVLVVAAAGNQGAIGSSPMTRHPWVLPVVACDERGKPTPESNLSNSGARRGLAAPGKNVTSLGAAGDPLSFSGTSAATPFVTGAIALLWSEFPSATAGDIKTSIARACPLRRKTIVPPLLDAWAIYEVMAATYGRT